MSITQGLLLFRCHQHFQKIHNSREGQSDSISSPPCRRPRRQCRGAPTQRTVCQEVGLPGRRMSAKADVDLTCQTYPWHTKFIVHRSCEKRENGPNTVPHERACCQRTVCMHDIQVLQVYSATKKVSIFQTLVGISREVHCTYVTHTIYMPAPMGISARSCATTDPLSLTAQENSSNPPDSVAIPAIWWMC